MPHPTDPTLLNIGNHTYAFDDQWAQVPAHITLGITHGLAIDGEGFIHVLHTVHADSDCRDAVAVFAPDGQFVRSWGPQFDGSGHGIHLVEENGQPFAYVTDLNRGLFKTTLHGETVWHLAKPSFYDARPHLAYEPTNVAVAPNGDVFLSDGYGSYLIFHLDKDGNELNVFGGPGIHHHHLAHPHGLIYTERLGRPALLVAENIATRLNYLSLEGKHLGFIDVDTRRPRHFHEQPDGTLVVPDFYSRVTLIDAHDQLVAHFGDAWDEAQRQPKPALEHRAPRLGEFVRPHDAVFDAQGNLYVSEYVETGRVVKLTQQAD